MLTHTSCSTRIHSGSILLIWGVCLVAHGLQAAEPAPPSDKEIAFFESKIRPLLVAHCVDCHGEDAQESSLRLDTYAGMVSGGTSGPAVVPGEIDESLLLAAIRYDNEHLQMPPDGKLAATDIQLLEQWIQQGAPHPERGQKHSVTPRKGAIDLEEARKYWAFQPIQPPEVPAVESRAQPVHPIDAFIFSTLKKQGLTPNPAADKRTLIRRATFDLIGLPPTPDEVEAFLADDSPQAFEKVIDRLLASKQYGERWGRHWLDVVRYADSNGQDENQAFVDAWRYRNYVIEAFNEDKPFDQFLMEQVAGDLLNAESQANKNADDYDAIVATGFLSLGPKVLAEKDVVKMEMDIIDEQIDTFGQAFLGMTIACARCHDHKFDPISTADYYALAGIFKSTKSMESFATIAKYNERVLATEEEVAHKAKLEEQRKGKQAELDALVKSANEALLKTLPESAKGKLPPDAEQQYPEKTRRRLAELREEVAKLTTPDLPTAMAVEEGKVGNVRIHVRGSHLMLGKEVARGVPEILQGEKPLEIGEDTSGRLELARWLVGPENPLTARVAVNRIWRWHFGRGLAATTDNFGKLGEPPTHPQLLDWLAAEFMAGGWSVKRLHKQIMLSETYRLSSGPNAANEAIDPENRWHWRANIQRLDAESLRDAVLAVSGQLDPSPAQAVLDIEKWQLVFDHTSKDATSYDSLRRSVYLPVIRNNLYDGFSLFDYATADVTAGDRATSTVAPQALYTLNSELVLSAADALAKRLREESPDDEEARAERLFQITLGRPPEPHEQTRLLNYVRQLEPLLQKEDRFDDPHLAAWSAACQSVLASNEFTYCE